MNDKRDVIIRAENVKKFYKTGEEELWALKGINLDIYRGEFISIMGPSGSGKSTFFNQIGALDKPTEGRVFFEGHSVCDLSESQQAWFRCNKIGYIFQDFKLMEEMTAEDNINVLKLEGVRTDRMDEVLDALGILAKKKKKVSRLSGGERQRVAIARAFVKAPDIILADEPTGNLNYEIGRSVVEQMLTIARGKTLIAVTHDDRLATLFDRVIDMNEIASAESEVRGDA